MFNKKTIIVGSFLVLLFLIISGILIWQVGDNNSKKILINKQNEELMYIKEENSKIKKELKEEAITPNIVQEEHKNATSSFSWRENVIDCLNNYPTVFNHLDYEATGNELKNVFLNNSFDLVCNRLWHGTEILATNLDLDEGARIIRGDNLYFVLEKSDLPKSYIQIDTKTVDWELKQDKNFPGSFTSGIQFPGNSGKFLYTKYIPIVSPTTYPKPVELWVYDFFTDTDKKVYSVPDGYILSWCGEGTGPFAAIDWLNSNSVRVKMGKVLSIISPDLCLDDKGNHICGECGESFDDKYAKEVILNNL